MNRNRLLVLIERKLPYGVGRAACSLIEEVSILMINTVNHARGSFRYRNATGIKLQMGCGPRLKQGWVNVDLSKSADIHLDIRRKLPFRDGSCSVIYSEHFLEHLGYPEPVRSVLKDCLRILQPGGRFTFAVPDIDLVLRTYVHGGTHEYYEAQKRWNPAWYTTQIEHINYNFRQDGEHQFAYDVETFTKLLGQAGFNGIVRREFDPALDSEDRRMGSLYMEARKP